MCQMEHAFVQIPDEELLAGERDYNGARGVGGGVNPHVILKSFMLYLLEHCRKRSLRRLAGPESMLRECVERRL